jgi:phage tail tape-measure protein
MTAGAGIASVVGGIIGSVVPVVGTIVGSTLGIIIAAAWGGKKALELTGRQDLTAARREVLVAVDKDLGNMMVVANAEFSKTTRAIEAKSRDAIQEIIDQNQKRLTEQKKALQARAKSDRAELAEEEKVVRMLENNISEIEQQIKAMGAAMQR